ncbi:hypothetical protein ACFLRW_05610 [Acidobacteriota bacterium]
MKHKKLMFCLSLGFLILALCTPGIPAEKFVQSQWTATPPTIDGSNSDWEGGTLTLYKKTKVDYAFRNDADNLYVIFIFNDPRGFMSSIQQSGITLWLNTEGKKKKDYGIKFAIKTVSADNYIQIVEEMLGEPMPEEKREQIKAKDSYQIFHNEVIDKKGEAPDIASGPTAPAFNTAGGRETMVYEFKVPLKKDESNPVGIGTQPGGSFTLGFEWGGSTKEMRQQKITSQTARGSTGRGTGASSTLTGETGGGGGGGMNTMAGLRSPVHIFWTAVKLADKQ